MSYPRRQRSFWARIKLSVEKFVPRAKRGKFFLTIHICRPVRQELQYDVEALKNKIDEKRTIQQLLYNCHFYILRSEFYRLRQNSNWTFKNLFHCEPVVTLRISALWLTLFRDSLEIISAWQWCQRDEDHITAAKMVNSFLKNNFFGAFMRWKNFWAGCP